ncbi:MAG TPA: hypothetical protein VGF17_28550 [Phytomonospora sp.]
MSGLSAELFADYLSVLGGLLTAAQSSGAVRDDVDTMDVHALIWGAAQIEAARRDTGRDRHLTRVIAEGLRADVTKPLPVGDLRNETPQGGCDETSPGAAVCAQCGKPIEPSRTGRPARFCGAACRQKAHRASRR